MRIGWLGLDSERRLSERRETRLKRYCIADYDSRASPRNWGYRTEPQLVTNVRLWQLTRLSCCRSRARALPGK